MLSRSRWKDKDWWSSASDVQNTNIKAPALPRAESHHWYATRCSLPDVYSCFVFAIACYLGQHAVSGSPIEAFAAEPAADLAGISRVLVLPLTVPLADGLLLHRRLPSNLRRCPSSGGTLSSGQQQVSNHPLVAWLGASLFTAPYAHVRGRPWLDKAAVRLDQDLARRAA